MADIVKYLFKSFILLRDLVGYLIPGLAFLALLDPSTASDFVASNPSWLAVIAVLLLAYAAAQVLAGAGYALLRKLRPIHEPETLRAKRYKEFIYFSTAYPDIFIQSNREETVHMMRIGLSVALFFAGAFHLILFAVDVILGYETANVLSLLFWIACLIAGALLYWNCLEGDDYFRRIETAAIEAARMMEDAAARNAGGGATAANAPRRRRRRS